MNDYPFLYKTICTYFPTHKNINDLYIYSIGFERCSPNKAPLDSRVFPKTEHIIHYVIDGEGTLFYNGNEYTIEKNTIFFLPPKSNYIYRPNPNNPWTYLWIEYAGYLSYQISTECHLLQNAPVFHPNNKQIYSLIAQLLTMLMVNPKLPSVFTVSTLYQILEEFAFMHELDKPDPMNFQNDTPNPRLTEVVHYIDQNYAQPNLSLNILSEHFHFNASYLSRIFHRDIGKSVSEYIMDLRLTKAFELLKNTHMIVKEVSLAVGYEDVGFFSKIFRRKFGETPSKYFKTYTPTI